MLLPGLAQLRLPLPLGGSSNHFRTAALRETGGWDPYNVTEDADLGMRLARLGYRAAVIDSTTYEEAPARVKPWIRQRTRWFKGWMRLVKLWRLANLFSFLWRTLSIAVRPSQRCRNKMVKMYRARLCSGSDVTGRRSVLNRPRQPVSDVGIPFISGHALEMDGCPGYRPIALKKSANERGV